MMKSFGKRNRSPVLPVLRRPEKHEEQGVIKDDNVGGEESLASLLKEAV